METKILLALIPLLLAVKLSTAETKCPSLQKPTDFDKNQFIGTWYALRGIEHSEKASSNTTKHSKKCSEIVISSKNGGESWKFNWNSKNKPTKQFSLKHNPKTPGLLEGNGKGSFNSLQLTKLAGDSTIWAATFCRTNGGVSSVILSKSPAYAKDKVDKITEQLSAQGLDVSNHYDRCAA
ncbi:Hypothetical protein NTJ_00275 [Nesidiocoris tenuis]|uniref:Lipocalin/cytosolic fatty-acid binding domain-containing protein n=1 Tax=Nesidiocoris tenuis TaxID=355587 RepID=A0ABN7A5Y0_9HEMI|nr:Hypothetical protein NTJ_00275 [Nesidiocoris tenuis]